MLERNQKYEDIIRFYHIFCAFMSFYCDVVEETSMFVWGELKREVPNSVRFCIGDLPMYIFFIPTHPYSLISG